MLKLAPLLSALLLPAFALGAMYKWIDQDGNTVYSQTPPPDGISSSKMEAPPPPAEPQAQRQLQELKQRLEDAKEDRELAKAKHAEQQQEQQKRAQNCRRAKRNLSQIEQRSRQLEHDGNGNYRRLTPEQKQARIAEYKAVIAKDCTQRKGP